MAGRCVLRSSLLMILFGAVIVAGCTPSTTTEKKKEAPRVTVAHPVIQQLIDEDDYNGWLEESKRIEVRARVRGHITKVHFRDGDLVQQGQPLFDLDVAPFEAELKQAEAQIAALEAQKVAADKEVERNRNLLKSNAVSQQEFEKSEATAKSFGAQIRATIAEAERRRLDVQYAKITAELSGRISKAELTEGNLVNAGGSDPLLTTIVAIDPIYVDFNVDERAMQRYQTISLGGRVSDKQAELRDQKLPFAFGLDTEKGYPHQGQIVFADNKYAEGTGTILMRGMAPNPDGRLIPGSRVRVRIPIGGAYEACLVPDTAVNTDQDQKYLLVVGENNVVKRQNVRLGRLLDDGMRVVREPKLKADEWIIVEGMELARLNYPVEPIPESVEPAVPAQK